MVELLVGTGQRMHVVLSRAGGAADPPLGCINELGFVIDIPSVQLVR